MISDNDLLTQLYDIPTLIQNRTHLNKKTVLYTQRLTAKFCAYYIFEEDSGSEDSYLFDKSEILEHQPHVNPDELSFYIKKINS